MSLPPRTVTAGPSEMPGDGDGVTGFYAWSGECYSVPMDRTRIIIGRQGGDAARLDIALPDSKVSSMHCIIERHGDGQFELHDCSKNGSHVNGVLVHHGAVGFRSGDALMVGETTLVALSENGPSFGPGPLGDEVFGA